MARTRWLLAAFALALCSALAACGSDGEDLSSSGDSGGSTEETVGDDGGTSSTDGDDGGTSDNADTGSSTTTSPEDDDPDDGAEDSGVPADLLPSAASTLAPAAERPTGVLWYWTDDLAGGFGHGTEWSTALDGPIAALAEVPLNGLVFQREDGDGVIWFDGPDGPTELITADENEYLRLEGAGLGPDEEPLVYYQRYVQGSVEDTVSTLRSHDLASGEDREILVTGGWESGMTFDHLTDGVALGLWGGEGFSALVGVDLASGDVVLDTRDEACGEGEDGCLPYWAGAASGGRFYGIRPTSDDGSDALGLFRYDPATGTDELVIAFDGSEGAWEVENLFAWPGGSLTLSLRDGAGRPLPAVTVDPSTGAAESWPLAALVRPAHLT